MLSVEEATVTNIIERIPAEIAPVDPTDPEYEMLSAIADAGKRNLDYFLKHEAEINERHPGPCTLLIFNGDQVRACSNFDEVTLLLDTLSEVESAAALQYEQPEHGSVWIL